MKVTFPQTVAAAFVMCAGAALAGRPLATDDASVPDPGSCQIEAWVERPRDGHALVLAPACGIAAGWELGADYTRERSPGVSAQAVGLGAKWVPARGTFASPLGTLRTGLKVRTAQANGFGNGWQASEHSVLAIASLEATPAVAIHFNLGAKRDPVVHVSGTLLNAALAWSATERTLLFAEVQVNDRAPLFGAATRTAGARWWLVKEVLGVDLTASRQAGSGGTRWSFGLGWYGL